MKVIYSHVIAFASFVLLIAILGVLHRLRILVFKQQFKAFTLNLLVFFLPGMITQLVALVSKRTINEITNEEFTVQEVGIVWNSYEFRYSYYLVLPLLFFWISVFSWVVYVVFVYGKNFYPKKTDQQLLPEPNERF
jgi:hypothetical protein